MNDKSLIIWICSPLRSGSRRDLENNLRVARKAGEVLLAMGHAPVIPHTMMTDLELPISEEELIDRLCEIVKRCNAIAVPVVRKLVTNGKGECDVIYDPPRITSGMRQELRAFSGEACDGKFIAWLDTEKQKLIVPDEEWLNLIWTDPHA